MPIFGFFLMKTLFTMFIPDKELMYTETMNWILVMALVAISEFFYNGNIQRMFCICFWKYNKKYERKCLQQLFIKTHWLV